MIMCTFDGKCGDVERVGRDLELNGVARGREDVVVWEFRFEFGSKRIINGES